MRLLRYVSVRWSLVSEVGVMSGIVFSRVDIAGLLKACQSFFFSFLQTFFGGMVRVQYSLLFDSTVFSEAEFFSAHLSLSFLVLPPCVTWAWNFMKKC